ATGTEVRATRRLHAVADPARRVPHTAYAEDAATRSAEGLYLRHQFDRLHLRSRGPGERALEDAEGLRRRREEEPGQDRLRLNRHRDHAASGDGGIRTEGRDPIDARAVQGQRGADR